MLMNASTISIPLDLEQRIRVFFGHYNCRVYLSKTAYVEVGRGSLAVASKVKLGRPDLAGCLGTVGNFTEMADISIFVGMEHQNSRPVNATFGDIPIIKSMIAGQNIHELRSVFQPFSIGNGVVLSHGVTLLDGACVADGVVVGAAAIVKSATAPFSIVVGAPAKTIAYRFDEPTRQAVASIRWWDFKTEYILRNLASLQDMAVSDQPHEYQPKRPAFIVRAYATSGHDFDIAGFVTDDGTEHPLSSAPQNVRDYVNLAIRGEPVRWTDDVWRYGDP
jgi:hypothetical protein